MVKESLNSSKFKGELELKIYKDDKLIETHKDHNLIVRDSCCIIANALQYRVPEEGESRQFAINQICWGNTYEPLALATEKMAGDFYHRPIVGHFVSGSGVDPETAGTSTASIFVDPETNTKDVKLIITFNIAKSEVDITQIRQFGLACSNYPLTEGLTTSGSVFDGYFFSIINRFPDSSNYIHKDNTVNIEGRWEITFLNSSSQ